MEEIRNVVETIREDHDILLRQIRILDEALALFEQDEHHESQVLQVLAQVEQYFRDDVLQHLQQEEKTFIPPVEQLLPDGGRKAVRLREEHHWLRGAVEVFESALSQAVHAESESKSALFHRLAAESRTILNYLNAHAAYESELMREMLARKLSTLNEN